MHYLGCHLSLTKGYEAMGKAALSIGANTFAFFTRNPRGGRMRTLDIEDMKALEKLLKTHGFGPLVAHAPYTINPASATAKTVEFAHRAMAEDLERLEFLPGNYYNFHPGSHVGQGVEKGLLMVQNLLNEVLHEELHTTVLLETMAGKGTELGRNFEELAAILSGVRRSEKVGICLDTCHLHEAGYNLGENLSQVLDEFDRVLGLSRLKALHINDSKNPLGAQKDRHEKIGQGTLGIQFFQVLMNEKRLEGLPMILETPQEKIEGYGKEILELKRLVEHEA